MNSSPRVALIHIALVLLWVPAAIFWRFASWQARLQTVLDNERASHDRR